jgi:hypothetical protein
VCCGVDEKGEDDRNFNGDKKRLNDKKIADDASL